VADLDLRLVRYFTVVAEHQNFGRAAAALHLAQPHLSRQIQRLEEQLGARLLDRTPQGSHLTEAGRVFLPQAQALLRSARQADVRTRHLDWADAHAALPEHRVDALVARLPFPFPADGLRVTVLYDEPRVLVVPAFHRLAGKESVILDDFADEPLVRFPVTDTAWSAFWRLEPRPNGRPAPAGPVVETFEDKLEFVAGGLAVAILPAGDQRSTLRPDLTTVPIEGIEPCQVVVATRANERSRLVTAFRECARTHLTGHA